MYMEQHLHYGTVLEALENLRQQGYSMDFNLDENYLICGNERYSPQDFEVDDVYRYEGNSNPDDESVVYAITTQSGKKGTLVSSYGVYSELSEQILQKLTAHRGK
jgi:hypothetical protein